MINVIVALPKIDDARNIKNLLVKSGIPVAGVCTSGAQALALADGLGYCYLRIQSSRYDLFTAI